MMKRERINKSFSFKLSKRNITNYLALEIGLTFNQI